MTNSSVPVSPANALIMGGLHSRALVPSDLAQMVDLQTTIYRCLPEQHKSFIVLKTPDTFAALLHPPHAGAGIFNQHNQLVAQAFLKIGHASDLAGLTDSPAARLLAKTAGPFGVPQGVLVHPDYRGQHLMGALLNDLEEKACGIGLKALVTEVAVGNDRSHNAFLHHDYTLAGEATDYDGTQLMFLHKPLYRQHARPEGT